MIETTKQKWRVITKIARKIGVEGFFNIDEGGLSLSLSDPADVIFVDASFSPNYFETFERNTDNMCVDYTSFDKTFGRFKKSENVRVKVGKNERIWHESDRKEFSMRQIDIQHDSIELNGFNTPTQFCVEKDEFQDMVEDADYVSDSLAFHISDGVIVESQSKQQSFKGILTEEVTTDEQYKAMFRTDFLTDVIDVLADADTITCNLGDNKPMIIRHQDDNMSIQATIAPMVNKE